MPVSTTKSTNEILVLSLHQPWASLIALGVKTIETRSWSTRHRGPLAIHAAARRFGLSSDTAEFIRHWPLDVYRRVPRSGADAEMCDNYPLGAIVATCTLVDCVLILGAEDELTVAWQRHVAPNHHGDLWLWNGPSETESPSTGRPTWLHEDITDQRPYGDFAPGRWAWILEKIEPVDPPVPFRGGQGLSRRWEQP